jgi:hypothetical protein
VLAERAVKDAERAVAARPGWAKAYSRLVGVQPTGCPALARLPEYPPCPNPHPRPHPELPAASSAVGGHPLLRSGLPATGARQLTHRQLTHCFGHSHSSINGPGGCRCVARPSYAPSSPPGPPPDHTQPRTHAPPPPGQPLGPSAHPHTPRTTQGLALFLLERYPQAEQAYQKGLELEPGSSPSREGLAKVQEVMAGAAAAAAAAVAAAAGPSARGSGPAKRQRVIVAALGLHCGSPKACLLARVQAALRCLAGVAEP